MKLNKLIKTKRLEKGYSQRQLATLLDIKYQQLQRWERGSVSPRFDMIKKLCEILDIDPQDITLKDLIQKD